MRTEAGAKVRPILFSGAMVRAILDGSKTQTRRVTKLGASGRVHEIGFRRNWHLDDPDAVHACPYGTVGDRLWGRETFWDHGDLGPNRLRRDDRVEYRATPWDRDTALGADAAKPAYGYWKPSIHMPRWASRITLELTDVRIERVQAISSSDAIAEGIMPTMRNEATAVDRYRDLWDSLNAARGYSWEANPWVWALTFRRAA